MTPPVVPVMQKLQDSMDGLLSRSDLGDDERAKHYMQLQNKYLTFKQQLNSRLKESNPRYSEEQRQISSNSIQFNSIYLPLTKKYNINTLQTTHNILTITIFILDYLQY